MRVFVMAQLMEWLIKREHAKHRSQPLFWSECEMQPCFTVAKSLHSGVLPREYDPDGEWRGG